MRSCRNTKLKVQGDYWVCFVSRAVRAGSYCNKLPALAHVHLPLSRAFLRIYYILFMPGKSSYDTEILSSHWPRNYFRFSLWKINWNSFHMFNRRRFESLQKTIFGHFTKELIWPNCQKWSLSWLPKKGVKLPPIMASSWFEFCNLKEKHSNATLKCTLLKTFRSWSNNCSCHFAKRLIRTNCQKIKKKKHVSRTRSMKFAFPQKNIQSSGFA